MKKNVLIVLSLLMGEYLYAEINELTPQQVYQEIRSGQVLVLDVNPEKIFNKHHVPKSKNIGFNNIDAVLPNDKNKKLIFYCMDNMCSASHQAAQTAVAKGYRNVARMPSGIRGWLKVGLPTEKQ